MPYDSAFGQMMSNVFGAFDLSVFRVFGAIQNDIFTFLANVFTCLGEPMFIIMLGFTCCVLVLFKRSRKIGMLIGMAIFFYVVANDFVLKYTLERIRPYNALQGNAEYFSWYMNAGQIYESAYCFPSGHTCSTFAIATVLFFWIKNDMKKSECWMVFFIPAFVGLSRIYLMLHYPTDVIAGTIEGIIIGICVWYFCEFCIWFSKFLPESIRKKNNIDFEPQLSKKLGRTLEAKNVVLVVVLVVVCFGITTFTKNSVMASHVEKCNHSGPDYICMNEGKYWHFDEQTGEFQYFCELHRDEIGK